MIKDLFKLRQNPAKLLRESIDSFIQLGLKEQEPRPQPTEQAGPVYSGDTVTLTKEAYHKLLEENQTLRHEVAQMEAIILSCQTAIRNGGFG
ncbi:hypothetical protein [Streptococcus sp. E17BB]|uniref:hypothetical protein n=1 Tax=Streptococcus sp. E17BB TaxID=3278714 RepID=UPI00359EB114